MLAQHARLAPGALLLDADAKPPLGPKEQIFRLAGDTSGTMAAYDYLYVQGLAADVKVGVELHGANIGLTSSTKMESSIGLKFNLRSGVDYQLYRTAEGDGLLWG